MDVLLLFLVFIHFGIRCSALIKRHFKLSCSVGEIPSAFVLRGILFHILFQPHLMVFACWTCVLLINLACSTRYTFNGCGLSVLEVTLLLSSFGIVMDFKSISGYPVQFCSCKLFIFYISSLSCYKGFNRVEKNQITICFIRFSNCSQSLY